MTPDLISLLGASIAPIALYTARVGGVFVTVPVLNHDAIPAMARVGLVVALSVALFGALGPGAYAQQDPLLVAALMVLEFMVGAVMGTMARLLFAVSEIAGEFLSFQMGFAAASLYDPTVGSTAAPPTRLFVMVTLILFLTIDGHHQVLLALGGSYQHVPVGAAALASVDFSLFFDICYGLFEAAARLAFPFVFVMLAINMVLGVLARFVPQINVFIIGFIFTMGFGMLAMAEMMPSFGQALLNLLSLVPEVMRVARP